MAKRLNIVQTPLPFAQPPCSWKPTPVSQLPSWADAKRVSIDIETHDPDLSKLGPGVRRGAYICGVSFKIEDGGEYYLPIRHSEDNLPEEHVFQYLRDQSAVFKGHVVGANLQYDLDFLWEKKILFEKSAGYLDVQIAEPLIDERHDSYSLDAIATRYGLPGKEKTLMDEARAAWGVTKGCAMRDIPGRYVAEYAIQDVRLPLLIMRRQERIIEEQDLHKIFDLESRLLPALLRMRRRGVRVNFDRLQQVSEWTVEKQLEHLQVVKDQSGVELQITDLNKPAAMAKALLAIGIDEYALPRTPKTNAISISNKLLEGFKHPVADALLAARKMNKLNGTFVESVRRHACKDRIHPTFNQMRKTADAEDDDDTGARYGRLSCTDPNLQQQPGAKDIEIGKVWRSIYIPDEGKMWCAADYSQQEPRMIVHFAELTNCSKAFEAAERYRNDPNCDNHTMMAQMIAGEGPDWKPPKAARTSAKIIFLGLAYGMGGAKLARSLGLPTEWKFIERMGKTIEVAGPEADAMLKDFHRKVPFIKELSDIIKQRVSEKGFIRTILGRVCRFDEIPVEERQNKYDTHREMHKGLNKLAQGSSADQTKLAVLEADAAGLPLQLQVHDEIDMSVTEVSGKYPEAEHLADIMQKCLPLRVPSKVDIEIAENWGASL